MTVSKQNTNLPNHAAQLHQPLLSGSFPLIARNPSHYSRNLFSMSGTNPHRPISCKTAMKAQIQLYPDSFPGIFSLKPNNQAGCRALAQPVPIRRNPNPVRQRSPVPEHHRQPAPIRPPVIHPSPRHRCPCLKKEDETSAFQKDKGKQPGIRRSVSHPVFIMRTEEYQICGYETEGKKMARLILGNEKENGTLCYCGCLSLGNEAMDELVIRSHPRQKTCPFGKANNLKSIKAVWLMPGLQCLISITEKSPEGIILSAIYCTLINNWRTR